MGWARTLFLGDIGNRLDIAVTERDVSKIRMKLNRQRGRDASQDKAIEQLRRENEDLELCIAALVKTLERKGVLSSDEVTELVNLIEAP